jgi:phosphorylase/glycogen(starch) synthase
VTAPYTLFETSWEVCNKVGGIHTVVSTKAKTLVERFGDEYVAIGPWLLSGAAARDEDVFEEEAGFEEFAEGCRALGVPVRVGRWKIPGRPRTILVEFSGLFAQKDAILSRLWEAYRVDSLFGDWDYVEPVLFGHAAAIVIEKWHAERTLPARRGAVAQFHEWMTGSGMLRLKEHAPSIGTVFTTHATILGRSLAAGGVTPLEGLRGRTSEQAALELGIRAKHSIEGVCAREADVFTTVSDITADEAELFFQRRAAPLLPNGIDLDVIDELAGPTTRDQAEEKLRDLATRFLGEDASQAALLCISGRYEFHNKGIDLLLDALAGVAARPGREIVLYVLVPAGNSGLRSEVIARMTRPLSELVASPPGPVGISTHNLFDFEHDPLHRRCAELGIDNRRGSRVRVIQIPVYFNKSDGLLNLPYEALLRAMDLSCFPSFYEPWGYTPEESLAVGVPTVTTDCAGFGRWALERKLGPENGVFVLARVGVTESTTTERLGETIERWVAEPRDRDETVRVCRNTARLTSWSGLVERYYQAFERALVEAERRAAETAPPVLRAKVALPVAPVPQGQRPRLTSFEVAATMPEPLRGLERLARNLWWSWDPEAGALFRELYPAKWESSHHNAVRFLREIYPEDLRSRAGDAEYVARLRRVMQRFDAYLARAGAEIPVAGGELSARHPVAYFCAEFGIHESLPIYSGGLGILAGDHLKSASDLGLPLVGVGLFYKKGYLHQRMTSAGEQIGADADNDPNSLAVEAVTDGEGRPLEIALQLPSSSLVLRAWKVAVGRVSLYLLDANVAANRPEDRDITRQLYGGDHEHRLRQEIVLGRGGARLLERLGIEPAVFHVNEGHAAFLALERVGRLIREQGLTFDEAREIVRASTVFTTHTPVPAGHDRFGEDLIRRYFSDAPGWVGVPWERFYALGQAEDDRGAFNMTYLALHFAAFANGVSALHGKVSQRLLHPFWPKLLENEVPVGSITNGVHLPTWTDPGLARLFGAETRPVRGEDFERSAAGFDAGAFSEIKQSAKRRLVDYVRESLEESFVERHDSPTVLHRMLAGLDERCLWIGFARRFAPYKRAQLLFRDPERLRRLLDDPDRPVRIVFAGKAHPNDRLGQEILRAVVLASRSDEFVGRIFFLEDYEIELARRLVQGVDVWLNNPIRPLEASGTSGMKVAANGGLNLSVLDGWWIEAYDGENGWAVGGGRVFPNQELQDSSTPRTSTTCSRRTSSRSTTSARRERRSAAAGSSASAAASPRSPRCSTPTGWSPSTATARICRSPSNSSRSPRRARSRRGP